MQDAYNALVREEAINVLEEHNFNKLLRAGLVVKEQEVEDNEKAKILLL